MYKYLPYEIYMRFIYIINDNKQPFIFKALNYQFINYIFINEYITIM